MHYHELLTEMIWADRFDAAKAARQFPRGWIHFSNVQKLGVHPTKGHHDPPGIYFYPVNWLFGEEASLSQFATEYPYYYIVRFNKGANIVNLGKMTMDAVTQIATASNWLADLQAITANPALLANDRQPMNKRLLKRPGGLFYACVDYLANVKGRPWLGLMRGCDGLYDPGFGFISAGEIAQAVVFGRQHVTVVAQGENKDNGDREYAQILRQIAAEMGGKFYFQNKMPVADFANDGRPFRVTLKLWRYGIEIASYQQGFWMVNIQKYDTHAGDRAYHLNSIKSIIASAARDAGPPGPARYWNGDSVTTLLQTIRGSATSEAVKDDGLHIWQSGGGGFGGSYGFLNAVIDHEGQLTVNAEITIGDTIHCKVKRRFGEQPSATVAKTILDALARQLIKQAKNPAALKGGNLIQGFNFGDRFEAL